VYYFLLSENRPSDNDKRSARAIGLLFQFSQQRIDGSTGSPELHERERERERESSRVIDEIDVSKMLRKVPRNRYTPVIIKNIVSPLQSSDKAIIIFPEMLR